MDRIPRVCAQHDLTRGCVTRLFVLNIAFVASALSVAGCTSTQLGPQRPITIADDVAWARPLAEPNLSAFYNGAAALKQAEIRNEMLTARMYIADTQYHIYEAGLTRELQDEGFLATAASLGLTTSATLIPAAQTKAILSGVATAVTGLDKAYDEKVLLSNTIQALQTQMRADRKTLAATIYAKMFKDAGNNSKQLTPISEYTLPMALSDADAYYQAGTIASALIGLSKTVANAETNADQAKSGAGPNPVAVSNAQITAKPLSNQTSIPLTVPVRPTIIRDVNAPLKPFNPPPPPTRTGLSSQERGMSSPDMRFVLNTLCRPKSELDLGPKGSDARKALAKFLADNGKPSVEILDRNAFINLQDLSDAEKRAC